eukprot:scaffold52183_cov18-Tisochrysis_lutea.AAC.1
MRRLAWPLQPIVTPHLQCLKCHEEAGVEDEAVIAGAPLGPGCRTELHWWCGSQQKSQKLCRLADAKKLLKSQKHQRSVDAGQFQKIQKHSSCPGKPCFPEAGLILPAFAYAGCGHAFCRSCVLDFLQKAASTKQVSLECPDALIAAPVCCCAADAGVDADAGAHLACDTDPRSHARAVCQIACVPLMLAPLPSLWIIQWEKCPSESPFKSFLIIT